MENLGTKLKYRNNLKDQKYNLAIKKLKHISQIL
jgi:hypothetical protein